MSSDAKWNTPAFYVVFTTIPTYEPIRFSFPRSCVRVRKYLRVQMGPAAGTLATWLDTRTPFEAGLNEAAAIGRDYGR
jgi:hypothetical protein